MRYASIPLCGFLVLSAMLVSSVEGESPATSLARDKLLAPSLAQEPGSRDWLRAHEAARYRTLAGAERIDNCPHAFDVRHYDITLEIDVDAEYVTGHTSIIAACQETLLTEIDLDLTALTVDSVRSAIGELAFTQADPILTIDLGQSYAPGDTFTVEVFYGGHPGNEGPGGFGGFWFPGNPRMAFQMGVGLVADPPSMGKYWFPCWDWPCDKATADYHITVPEGQTAVCNGVLIGSDSDRAARTATYHWSETHQISPHVMSVSTAEYVELIDPTYEWIHYWVFPSQVAAAEVHFSNVDVMMDAFVSRYGPYPFDKFGYVAATKGDMEHQTCVTHVSYLIGAHHAYDWLLAHEMSHQWWGDCVTINDWRDIWLSEGFATYSEAIFQEYAYGASAYRTYMVSSLMNPVLASSENFPVYDPDYLWGTTVYEKGGTVLHMLRHVLGDEVFFDVLAAYRQAHEHQNAVTSQFQDIAETVSGRDLDWFFDEWIYDVGWPEYEYAWGSDPGPGYYDLNLIIMQAQTNGPTFTMPLDVRVATAGNDTLLTLWIDEPYESFTIELPDAAQSVTLDPDAWILKRTQLVNYAEASPPAMADLDLTLTPGISHSPHEGLTFHYAVPHGQRAALRIYNALGQQVAVPLDRWVPAGSGLLHWNGCGSRGRALPAGTYYCRFSTAQGAVNRRVVLIR